MKSVRTPEAIEQSRREADVPADWDWDDCATGCGDIVWHQPGRPEVIARGMTVVYLCSAECTTAWTRRHLARRIPPPTP